MVPFLVLLVFFAPARAQVNTVGALATQVSNIASTITTLQTRMGGLQRTTSGTAAGPVVLMDATLSSGTTKCGPQTITGWTENYDYWRNTATQTTSQFTPSTGAFVPPVNGYYKICSSARFQNSGNAVDMTLLNGGSIIAGYGSALQTDWRTTGVCTIQQLSTTSSITLRLQSGGSSDCVQVNFRTNFVFTLFIVYFQETSYLYTRLSIHLISCNNAACT